MLHFGSHKVFQPPIIHYVIVILSSSISVRLYHLYLSDVLEASVWPCIPENHFHTYFEPSAFMFLSVQEANRMESCSVMRAERREKPGQNLSEPDELTDRVLRVLL